MKNYIYITWKNFLKSQTGMLEGKLMRTDSGWSLESNVTDEDIMPVHITIPTDPYALFGLPKTATQNVVDVMYNIMETTWIKIKIDADSRIKRK